MLSYYTIKVMLDYVCRGLSRTLEAARPHRDMRHFTLHEKTWWTEISCFI